MDVEEKIKELDEAFFSVLISRFHHLAVLSKDLNVKEALIVSYLGKKRAASMSELISVCGTPKTTMTGIIKNLVKKGYVKRGQNSTDARVVEVTLTVSGKKFYRQFKEKIHIQGKKALKNVTEDEVKRLVEIIQRMNKSLDTK
ncbi:MAG TPA: MarR family transcriptional regulator [Halanaerobiales bacterium]|nr:MarR family transcriptional regulator [Halanaerobiales bacterium]